MGLFNWRTVLRGLLLTVGSWLIAMPCPTEGETCLTKIAGAFLLWLGGAIGSSGTSVKAGSHETINVTTKGGSK